MQEYKVIFNYRINEEIKGEIPYDNNEELCEYVTAENKEEAIALTIQNLIEAISQLDEYYTIVYANEEKGILFHDSNYSYTEYFNFHVDDPPFNEPYKIIHE